MRTGPNLIAGIDPAGYAPPRLHGTFVASLIAGHGSGPGNSEGVIGVAPAAHILSVRLITDDNEPVHSATAYGTGYEQVLSNGIRYAVAHGAQVINLSLGGPSPLDGERAAIGYAVAHGVVVVAAAGNGGSGSGYSAYSYPAAYPGVLSVAAVTNGGRRASFSDDNASVVISAPGVSVLGAGPGGQYLTGEGTSFSTAFVSGVAALIRSRYPSLSPALVEQAMVTSAAHSPPGGYRTATGFGEVNAPAALAAAGKLAAGHADHGLPATARFVAQAPAPIQVTYRNHAKIRDYTITAGAALLLSLTITAVTVLRIVRRRHPRKAAHFHAA